MVVFIPCETVFGNTWMLWSYRNMLYIRIGIIVFILKLKEEANQRDIQLVSPSLKGLYSLLVTCTLMP